MNEPTQFPQIFVQKFSLIKYYLHYGSSLGTQNVWTNKFLTVAFFPLSLCPLGSGAEHEVPYMAILGCCDKNCDEPANKTLNYL